MRTLLASLRVLDAGDADSAGIGRMYADLGADVLMIEPPGGSADREARPSTAGSSIAFAVHNANKRSVVLDPQSPADRTRFADLLADADIVVDSGPRSRLEAFGLPQATVAARWPHLVVLSVSDFGATGPRAAWRATDPVLYALSTALSRSGPTSGEPVLPPVGLASGTAAVQAAWAALVAHFHRLRGGHGEHIDFARFEAVVQALDPPFGSEGQAAVGRKPSAELWRGRPRNQQIYPIFGCADGHVRICLLSARQWRGMWRWLGEPERFADPSFETIAARYAASEALNAAIAELFASRSVAELVEQGQARGVPIAAVLTPAEALRCEHFRAVGALSVIEPVAGRQLDVPAGPFVVDGEHVGYRRPAPTLGDAEYGWSATRSAAAAAGDRPLRPFDGMRILDLGVIVAGGELGRLFADLGAEVIKVESAAYPDGLRQTAPGQPMSRSWALTHRNEYSLGLDLRHPAGADVFAGLVAGADAVFANFKPGTLGALGFSYDRLRALNPRIVLAESSAFGATGPWSARMGYGPLVRASTGITRLWSDGTADSADATPFDATTIFPDHVAARITAIAALAALIDRDRSGTGAHVHISQAEAAVNQLAVTYVAQAARAAGLPVDDDDGVHGVHPCAGDDEWCVVSMRTAADRDAVAGVVGSAEPAAISAWTFRRDKNEVAETMQAAGVPAAPMYRAADVLADPQVRHRALFSEMTHPLFAMSMPTETGPTRYRHIPPADLRPAPMPGEHTREICQKVLGLDVAEVDRLIAEGVLFTTAGRP
ncbi:CoA transferase [Mycobacterium sp. CPCC 205372]|uniref:CoA transferase n=1 Tax=Mycobacterium hippophais TaxID=3016340 RepID=A0ABT4PWX0_9MYCO|nr:CoA transferase [Mycobacterium hippophais]MCZ8381015.1 CoA transferase [Mycobacterium hippophais]